MYYDPFPNQRLVLHTGLEGPTIRVPDFTGVDLSDIIPLRAQRLGSPENLVDHAHYAQVIRSVFEIPETWVPVLPNVYSEFMHNACGEVAGFYYHSAFLTEGGARMVGTSIPMRHDSLEAAWEHLQSEGLVPTFSGTRYVYGDANSTEFESWEPHPTTMIHLLTLALCGPRVLQTAHAIVDAYARSVFGWPELPEMRWALYPHLPHPRPWSMFQNGPTPEYELRRLGFELYSLGHGEHATLRHAYPTFLRSSNP